MAKGVQMNALAVSCPFSQHYGDLTGSHPSLIGSCQGTDLAVVFKTCPVGNMGSLPMIVLRYTVTGSNLVAHGKDPYGIAS